MMEGGVPSIPVQPVSYGDAIHFMRYVLWRRHTPPVGDSFDVWLSVSLCVLQTIVRASSSCQLDRSTEFVHILHPPITLQHKVRVVCMSVC